jgi:transcriptional regulator with XRE-family HTH domain
MYAKNNISDKTTGQNVDILSRHTNNMTMDGKMEPLPQNALTAKQSRAGRALLAWSQQALAKKAGIAVSTVADFERGQRTPAPNSAEAMRSALEAAGVRFLPGGAVIGPPLPGLAATNKSGAPIRWVNATDLAQWADRRDAQDTIPTLLAKLIRASHGPAAELHFPSDEAVQLSGWDGYSRTDQNSPYVPAGPAFWEIGTQKRGIAGKANEDFEKRPADPNATFVFVTPRAWSKKNEWIEEKRGLNRWADVRAYDATDLVHWIEQYPAVGQWLVTLLGLRPTGARQLEDVWEEWSLATQWPLTEDLILSDRDEDAVAVLQWLRADASLLSLQGESVEEVVAFLFAAIRQLPGNVAQHYLARCLVAANAEAARMLTESKTPLIIVLLDPDSGAAQRIAKRGHHVLSAYDDSADLRGDYRRLARPSRPGIEQALRASGIPEARAVALARDSSRSLGTLRRQVPAAPGRLPEWADARPTPGLIAALLAGGWNEASEHDQVILSRLGNAPYDQLLSDIAKFADQLDSPLRKVGAGWKVASPPDAWSLLAPYLTTADIDRFEAAAIEVFSADDPRYDVGPEERWLADSKGIRPQYSGLLRHGIGQVLILAALFGNRARAIPALHRRAEYIVQRLLRDASRQRWWSLSRDFRPLAETAPTTFMDAVEDSLRQNNPPILSLFGADGGPFGGEHLSDLLWAFETLAWSPDNLARVAELLAKLDQLDPGGRFMNRPGNSLAKIFLLWFPQTHANLAERLRVIDRLRKIAPEAAWKLLLAILPNAHGTVTRSPHPRWRDYSPDSEEVVTYQLMAKGTEQITIRLLHDVGASPERWEKLLNRISNLAPDRKGAIQRLASIEPKILGRDDRLRFWEILRGVLNHHRQVPDAQWALREEDLAELESIYNRFEPTNLVQRIAWLYAPRARLPDPGVEGWRSNEANVAVERQRATMQLLTERGIEGVFELAPLLDLPGYLGGTIAEMSIDDFTRDSILARAVRSSNPKERDIAHGLIYRTFVDKKEPWAGELLKRAAEQNWGDTAILTILRALPVKRWTWEKAHDAGPLIEAEFWKRTPPLWMEGSADDVVYMADHLIAAGRARDAIHFVGHHLPTGLPTALLVRVLEEAIKQPYESDGDSNEPTMFQHYVAQILQELDKAGASEDQMLRLEWAYLPVLEYSPRPARILLKALSERPSFFMDVLSALFRPSEDSGVVEAEPDDAEHARAIASRAFNLLRVWDRVPGADDSGRIDPEKLMAWIEEVRKLAAEKGRTDIADQKIGEALSASIAGPDNIWPAIPVRDALEKFTNRHIETGFVIGRRNRRGVTTRMPRDGGIQERNLAETYRSYAAAVRDGWPHAAAAVEKIARGYDEDARWHDEDAERLDWNE